jgi:hypothetical protein
MLWTPFRIWEGQQLRLHLIDRSRSKVTEPTQAPGGDGRLEMSTESIELLDSGMELRWPDLSPELCH